jgi:RNA polymerase sigma-70 factor (ECF subfamily)
VTVPDDEGFDAFVARTLPRMLATATLYCSHRQRAEDAVQEAYVQAFRYWPLTKPEAWMRTTIRRQLGREARRWWLRMRPIEPSVPAPPSSSPEENLYAAQVLRAVGALPPRQRQILVMFCFEGRSYRDIAAELGISEGGVAANLAKARARTATLLGLVAGTPDRGDPLVAALADRNRLAADPVSAALRFTGEWLARGFEADAATLARLRLTVGAAAAAGPRRPGVLGRLGVPSGPRSGRSGRSG